MTTQNKLTHNACLKAKPEIGKARKTLSDGLGLKLNITATSKLWRFDYSYQNKHRSLSLGKFPEVSLAEARDHRDKSRRLLRDGRDPVRDRQNVQRKAPTDTMRALSAEWLPTRDWTDGHRRTVKQRLNNHILPYLGDISVSQITAPMVLECLKRMEELDNIESAHRVKGIIGQICRYAAAQGLCNSDPTAILRGALKKSTVRSFPAITDPAKLGGLLRAIDGYSGSFVVKVALQVLPLVFVRPGEHRKARWDEFNLDAAMWVIPAHRMKRQKNGPHTVPLSRQAVRLLRQLYKLTGNDTLVYPGNRGNGRAISENTLNAALLRLDIPKNEHVPHGFRHTASTLLNEQRFDADLIEVQLHHANGGIRRVYNRAQYIEQRHQMMQSWADYLDKLKTGAEVQQLEDETPQRLDFTI